ncbi:B12-binding domain-containing radical SAM protein [Clostridium felsineum]|uniref:B12-binding domain-containing radical SAM protein n=1 Tax=Clostridium felsineum TaxID=36839 RepID=UPI00098CDB56|nr:radical SAM protein [Clostridium felsineum]
MKKVLLTAINSQFIHSNLAVRYLKAYAKELDLEIKIREFSINDRIERVFEEIMEEKPDMIGFSCYIWNGEYVDKLSTLIKRVDESIQIFYGGPEVSFNCEEVLLNSEGDFLIEGEGEESFKEFLKWKLENGFDRKDLKVKGIYSKNDKNEIVYGGKREAIDMNSLVFPYNENEDLSNKIIYYEASRGCPFNCKYCLSSTIRGVRFLEPDRVKRELKFLSDKKVKIVKFVDRTFNADAKFAIEIWEYLMSLDTETVFHFEITADIVTEEEIELLKKAPKGRFQFEVGVQSTNNEVLRNVNRYIEFKDIKEIVMRIEEGKNINQHLDLIVGLPGENFESFRNSFNDVYSIGPEKLQIGFLKLLKGSSMREEAEKWGMSYSPYHPYEILKTKDISFEEISKLKRVDSVVDKYHNTGKFNEIVEFMIGDFDTPFDFYYSLSEYFYKKGYFSRSISASEYYKVFLDFNKEILKKENNVLEEVVKFEYLKFNKKSWLPPFLTRLNVKEEEQAIKEKLRAENKFDKKMHLEKFSIDIERYINKKEIVFKEKYYIFIV